MKKGLTWPFGPGMLCSMTRKTPQRPSMPPELLPVCQKYGCRIDSKPPLVIVGKYRSKIGTVAGIIAGAKTEFNAYQIRREVLKCGECQVHTTEYHPTNTPTFSIEIYKKEITALRKQIEKTKSIV